MYREGVCQTPNFLLFSLYHLINQYHDPMGIRAVPCPGAHHFRGLTPTIHANIKRALIAAKIAFARGSKGVSDSPGQIFYCSFGYQYHNIVHHIAYYMVI